MVKQTPMIQQYLQAKSECPEAILFFRLGDFYEMFFEDAEVASKELEITLTSRHKGEGNRVPMCGFPHHSASPYIARLVSRGFKVAICEQVEDPKAAKGIVRRAVTRVITPGTVIEEENLDARSNNYLLSIAGDGETFGLALLDISTGEFRATELRGAESLADEISRIDPREVLLPSEAEAWPAYPGIEAKVGKNTITLLETEHFASDTADRLFQEHFREPLKESLKDHAPETGDSPFGETAPENSAPLLEGLPLARCAAGAALHYARFTQKGETPHISTVEPYSVVDYMVIDAMTRRNLEVFESTRDRSRKGTLLGLLDRNVTPMGARKLHAWLQYPLLRVGPIRRRLAAVGALKDQLSARDALRKALDEIHDLERLNSRVTLGTAGPRDLVALARSLRKVPEIQGQIGTFEEALIAEVARELDPVEEASSYVDEAISDDPPAGLKDGGYIREGHSEELDELRGIAREGKRWISRMEAEERKQTGINSLKIRYNKVFGYYIEVTRPHLHLVPETYIRKQTLANAERYINESLKEMESKVLGAEERQAALEYALFQEVREAVARMSGRIQRTAEALATLDVLSTLAETAHHNRYCRPEVSEELAIRIRDGRHPVVERMDLGERFVPNDVLLDGDENRLLIITGPNMAGKSTYMRQVALIVLMAQVGSFVPASEASIGLVDRIFTRVGAADDLAHGRSTFMVEMHETAHILSHATTRSLILLDEIGRGTSTFDGLSIAWSVGEHISAAIRAKTLFATHYHELVDLAATQRGVRNYNIAVREWNDEVIFLRKIVAGGTSHSYGIQVARLAGLPDDVVDRAKEILLNLEQGEMNGEGVPRLAASRRRRADRQAPTQLSLFGSPEDELHRTLKGIEVDTLTPIEALNKLFELKKMAER